LSTLANTVVLSLSHHQQDAFAQHNADLMPAGSSHESGTGKLEKKRLQVLSLHLVAGARNPELMSLANQQLGLITLSAPLKPSEPGIESKQSKDKG